LKDGSTFSGSVTSNSTDSISLQAATGEARTYPMSQVASVQYGPAPTQAAAPPQPSSPAPPPANQEPQPAAPAPAPVSEPLPAPPVQSAPPVQAAAPPPEPAPPPAPPPPPAPVFRTIPAGTTISVRNNDTIDSKTAQVGQEFAGVVEQQCAR
jgi:hypothetical protein